MKVENCFGLSCDTLGEAVNKHVIAMGKLRAEINNLPDEDIIHYLDMLLYDIDKAHAELYKHLIECGVQGTCNETILKDEIYNARTDSKNTTIALAICIRDGIEKNYGCWDEWQRLAREMLKDFAPTVYKDLDSYETVTKGESNGK